MGVIRIASGLFLFFSTCALCLPQAAVPREWLLKTDTYGNSLHQRLTLGVKREELSGALDGDAIQGKISGNHLHFVATDKRNNRTEVEAQLLSSKMHGELTITLSSAPNEHLKRSFSGYALEEKPARVPAMVEFTPTKFYNEFSAEIDPVLTIWPGETIHTKNH
jgi:amidase